MIEGVSERTAGHALCRVRPLAIEPFRVAVDLVLCFVLKLGARATGLLNLGTKAGETRAISLGACVLGGGLRFSLHFYQLQVGSG
jgi:hypothetical protein